MENFTPLSAIQDGISRKLNATFGDGYTIHPEEVKQGLTRPCFFIKLLSHSSTRELGETYRRDNAYRIHFYPESTSEPEAECHRMLDALYLALEYIEVNGNLVRGVNMSGELVDGILHFHVNFNVRVRRVYDQVTMGYLESINLGTKG